MSEIRATTISDAAGTGPITLTGQSAAKAWVNFNGSGTIATRDSVNVASLTDNGTGNYSVNFSNSMGNASYSYAASSNGGSSSYIREAQQGTVSSGSFSYLAKYWSGITTANADDALYQNVAIHGDLA